MTHHHLGRLLRGIQSASAVLLGTVTLLTATATPETVILKLPAVPHIEAQDSAVIEAAQSTIASTLQQGVALGDGSLKLNLSPSNLGVSWLLSL